MATLKQQIAVKKNKALFTFTGKDGKKYNLTLKQKLFCEYYLDFKGNGVEAVIRAGYDVYKNRHGDPRIPNRRLAASIASENLTKPNISAYINLKLEESGFTDENVRKHHLFLLTQFANLSVKAKAIDMFYKIRGDYAPERLEHDVKLEKFLDRVSSRFPR